MRQGKPGPRGRSDHRITSAGKKLLKSGWRELLDHGPSGDLDADLRVALLTLWAGGERHLAAGFLRQSADKKVGPIEVSEQDSSSNVSAPLAAWYGKLRSASAKALLRAESAAALAMAENLPRNLSKKRGQRSRIARQKRA